MLHVADASAGPSSRAGIPQVGEVVAGKYRVDGVLGMGGMGVVLAVTHLQLSEPYALKCLLPDSAKDPELVERFMREARAAVRIKNEHIARVSDVGQLANGAPYILMEHLVGRDLSDVLSANGPLSVRDAVEYVLQACTGIAEAHALGIVHRDLKPSNLFLTQRLDGPPLVKVLDFGISKALGDGAQQNPSITQTSSVFGSPAYMSPEQIRSAKNVDFRTDVWALGVILYELITGALPFTAETAGGLLSAIAADKPHSLRERRPGVSEELEVVVRRCLEKSVSKRFQSVSELAEALEPFSGADSLVSVGRIRRLSGASSHRLPHLASPPSSGRAMAAGATGVVTATDKAWSTGSTPSRRGTGLYVLGAVALLVAAGVAGLFAVRSRPAPIVASGSAPAMLTAPVIAPVIAPVEPFVPALPVAPTGAPSPAVSASAAAAKGAAAARPPRVLPARPPHPATSAAPAPPATPVPPATSGAPRDPTIDSH